MIAVDTNVLVQAHRQDATFHQAAKDTLVQLAAGPAPWAIPWPCVHEFLAIVTGSPAFSVASVNFFMFVSSADTKTSAGAPCVSVLTRP